MKYIGVLVVIMLWANYSYSNHNKDFKSSKKIVKTYSTNEFVSLGITNKYGDIDIIPWNKDSILLEISFVAQSDKEDQLQEMLELASVDLASAGSIIEAETIWGKDKSYVGKSLFNIGRSIVGRREVAVHYKVHVPKYCQLRLSNEFGDINLQDHSGDINIAINHGNFRAKKLKGITELSLSYGKIRINQIETGRFNLKYVELGEVQTAGSLVVSSTGSNLSFRYCNSLNINSQRDKYNVDRVAKFEGNTAYSDIRISTLVSEAQIASKYGDILLSEITSSVRMIHLNGVNTDFEVYANPGFVGGVEVTAVDAAELNSSHSNLKMISDAEVNSLRSLSGYIGLEKTITKLKINSKKGSVYLGEN